MIDLNSGISILGFVGVIGFLWKVSWSIRQEINDLNKRIGQLEERVAKVEGRVAKIEGLLEGLGLSGKLPVQ